MFRTIRACYMLLFYNQKWWIDRWMDDDDDPTQIVTLIQLVVHFCCSVYGIKISLQKKRNETIVVLFGVLCVWMCHIMTYKSCYLSCISGIQFIHSFIQYNTIASFSLTRNKNCVHLPHTHHSTLIWVMDRTRTWK